MNITQGDLKPDLVVQLSDENADGSARVVNLTLANSVIVVGLNGDGTERWRRPATSITAGGLVTMAFQTADTATPGLVDVEVEVGWTDGLQTFKVGAVEVEPITAPRNMIVRVEDLRNHMSGVTFTAAQTAAAERVLAGVQRGLERALLRRFAEAEATEWTFADEAGWAMLSRSPVKSIVSVDGVIAADVSPFPYGGYQATRNGVGGLYPLQWTEVVYRGGGLPADDLEDVVLAILEKAADYMTNRHDDTRSVKDLDTREPTTKATTYRWTNAELDDWGLSRLRRRVVI